MPNTVPISDKLAYRLWRVDSLAVGTAVVNDFEVVVWGKPAVPAGMLERMDEWRLYPLGTHPQSAIELILECRGVLGSDFLRHFRTSFDFTAEILLLER